MRITRKVVALSVVPSLILGGYAAGRASVGHEPVHTVKAYACPKWEDDPRWNAARCGNRRMAVKIDVMPNDPNHGTRWVMLHFNANGTAGTFKKR